MYVDVDQDKEAMANDMRETKEVVFSSYYFLEQMAEV